MPVKSFGIGKDKSVLVSQMLYLKSVDAIEKGVTAVEFLENSSDDYWTGGHEYAFSNWGITE